MSKTIGASLKSHYQGEVTTLARLWKITLDQSPQVIEGYTNHVDDITIGGVTYLAASGYTSSTIASTSDLAVDNLDVYGLLDTSAISESDLLAGVYDGATVEILECNYADTSQGTVTLRKGRIGEITIRDNMFVAELRSLSQLLQQTVGEVTTPTCRADLGDSRCGVTLEPSDWVAATAYAVGDIVKATSYDGRRYVCSVAGTSGGTEPTWDTTLTNTTTDGSSSPVLTWTTYDAYTIEGDVTSLTDNRTFIDNGLTAYADDHFNGGLLTWTSGNNSGYSMEVKASAMTGSPQEYQFTLFDKMVNDIQVGDTFKVSVGCDKLTATCKTFSPENGARGNIYNFRGEPFIPGNDKYNTFGGQK